MNQVLENYIIQHSDPESDLLKELAREANVKLLRPRMISGHIQGRVLSMISKMIAPKRILEIGTFAGYSAICLAEGLNEEGLLYTIEIDDEMEDFAQSFISKSPLAKRINQIIINIICQYENNINAFAYIHFNFLRSANKTYYARKLYY